MKKINFSKVALLTSMCFLISGNSFAGIEKRPDRSIDPNSKFDLSVFNGTYKLVKETGDTSKGCFLTRPSEREELATLKYRTNAHDPVGVYHPSINLGADDIFHNINQGPSVIDNSFKPVGVADHLACIAFYSPDGLKRAIQICGDQKNYTNKNGDLSAIKNIYSSKTFSHLNDNGAKTIYQESLHELVPGKANKSKDAVNKQSIRAMELSTDGNTLKTIAMETVTAKGEKVQSSIKNCTYEKIK